MIPRPLRHDPNRTFSQHHLGPLNVDEYPWKFDTGSNGILMLWTEWCRENCKQPWAWWFNEQSICQVGFVDRSEMMEFCLRYMVDSGPSETA